MKKMPKYDVSEFEQELIDKIPEFVKIGNAEYIIKELTELYTNKENQDLLSALMIIEKYLFRAYELLYFVEGKGVDFDTMEYFFDEGVHNSVIEKAKEKLDKEEAERNYRAGVSLVEMGMNDQSATLFMDSALGGNIDGAYNYGVCLSYGEGCHINELESAFWYWVSANQGHARACENLALCFQDGKGVCADEMTMLYWHLRSFISGNSQAIVVASVLLVHGRGIPNQRQLGVQMYEASKDLHNMENYKNLMDTAFDLCEYLEPYIYNRYIEK